jgi:hypothetical protein
MTFGVALSPYCAQATEPQQVPQSAPDYHYECSLKEDFKPHGKVIGLLEIKKIYHADGKADATDAKLTFISTSFVHDAFPPMIDGYLRGTFIRWSEDQHKEIGIVDPRESGKSPYISPSFYVSFDIDPNMKIPNRYRYFESIVTIGKNNIVGLRKDGLTHFDDYYIPGVINLDRIEAYGGSAAFRLEDITNYAKDNSEISFYFTKLRFGKFKMITITDRIVLRRFSLDPKDFDGIDRMYQDKILPWEKGIVDYKTCEKVEDYNDIVDTKRS